MRSIHDFLVLILTLTCSLRVAAQCPLEWVSGGPQRDLTGLGRCSTLWDPDGAGPLPQRLVIGGALLAAADAQDQRVMTWDGAQWEALGPGPGTSGSVRVLAVWNGSLVAAGDFYGGGLSRIARWDGSSWQPLGPGLTTGIFALTVWNGNLVAAGWTGTVPTATAYLRSWDGTAWSTIPGPQTLQRPLSLASYQGLLCVGGYGANDVGAIERWNGSTWSAPITANNWVTSLAVKPTTIIGGSDTLFVGGFFTSIGGVSAAYLAVTTGGSSFSWSTVHGGLPSGCKALHVRGYGAGSISYVLTALTNDPTHAAMQLNAPLGGSASWVTLDTLLLDSVAYYGGAYHATRDNSDAAACLRHNGIQWLPVGGPGIDGPVYAATSIGNDVVVGGKFTSIAGVPASAIARWDGSSFQALGLGITGQVSGQVRVDALLTLANGDLVAGGLFAFAGTMNGNCIARWNGSTWSTFGAGMNQQVLALAELPNGDLVAGGWFTTADGLPCARIARWDGSQWQPFGAGANASVQALAVRQDGVLFAAGSFGSIDGVACSRIAQWNGTAWLPVGTGCNDTVFDLAVRPNGEVVAVGAFTTAGGVAADRCARWNGSTWLAMGTASVDPSAVRAVTVLADGDVVVGHGFQVPSQVPDDGLSRWNGSTWSAFGTILGAATDGNDVWCLAQRADGEVVVGGDFRRVNGAIARNLAAVRSTCMPAAQPYGSGCSSAAGPIVLTVDTLPWIDATFRTTTTGIAANALCAGLIGFTQLSIPLATLLPEGQPGCTLLTSPDAIVPLVAGPGTAHLVLPFANDPALIGAAFQHQTIPIEFDPFGAILAFRASNALLLVMGAL